ncbi:hypothetical protein [Rhodococcus erythropolis]|uniref:hypothetical protein n=1 Tax=Rhodococcus erythropolis TaxID=1833 RepID=UPI0030132FC9
MSPSSKSKTRKRPQQHERPPLTPAQFPELNGMFYNADPAEYLKMRIESLSLMLCGDDALRPAFSSTREIGVVTLEAADTPSADARRRFVATEANLIVHHAAETLLRMFYAHVEQEDCPWLGIASSVNFTEFKQKLDHGLASGFDREKIAQVFLGGVSVADSQIHVTETDFNEGIDAISLLLTYAAQRYLAESFVYNAAKHGLSNVMVDNASLGVETEGQAPLQIHQGQLQTYLHKNRFPGAKNEPRQWFMSATGTLPDQDLAVSLLIARAIDSLWNCARRKYLASPGQIVLLNAEDVAVAIYGPVQHSLNVVRTFTYELPKRSPDGSIPETHLTFVNQQIPGDWSPESGDNIRPVRRINLLVRQRDRRIHSTSRRHLLPFSPNGIQRV